MVVIVLVQPLDFIFFFPFSVVLIIPELEPHREMG